MNFEKIAKDYVKKYEKQDWFEGAILCGSYATGNNSLNSDVDIYIVSKDNVDWRERGNKLFKKCLIEYFINPTRKIKNYFEEEFADCEYSTISMFVQGKILYDKNGNVQSLKNLAQKYVSKKQTLSEFAYKSNCYSIWEHFDELDEKYKLNEDIDFLYYNFIYNAINAYFHNVHKLKIPYSKLEKIIFNTEFRKKYLIKKIAFNKDFEKLAKLCLTVKDREEKYNFAKKFYNFLMSTFKDFDINNYSLKSNC